MDLNVVVDLAVVVVDLDHFVVESVDDIWDHLADSIVVLDLFVVSVVVSDCFVDSVHFYVVCNHYHRCVDIVVHEVHYNYIFNRSDFIVSVVSSSLVDFVSKVISSNVHDSRYFILKVVDSSNSDSSDNVSISLHYSNVNSLNSSCSS